jgi:Flp pilus assembly protein TadG
MTRRALLGDRRGAAAIEFAIVAPVLVMLIMGLGDLSFQIYAQAILNGAVQKAGRDASIQGGAQNTPAIDAKVVSMVGTIMKDPTQSCATTSDTPIWCSSRKSYASFSVVKPEPFVDNNGNGKLDHGECFTDINGNGTWDADPGIAGQGGANDIALYTMTITYPRIFPVAGLLGWPQTQTISSSTLLKNQPYQTQAVQAPKQVCV